jgi:hypothetical protein
MTTVNQPRDPGQLASDAESLLLYAVAYKFIKHPGDFPTMAGLLGRSIKAFKKAEADPLSETCYLPKTYNPVLRDLLLANVDDFRRMEQCVEDCLQMAARCDIRRQGGGGDVDGYNWEFLEEAAKTYISVERVEGSRTQRRMAEAGDRYTDRQLDKLELLESRLRDHLRRPDPFPAPTAAA